MTFPPRMFEQSKRAAAAAEAHAERRKHSLFRPVSALFFLDARVLGLARLCWEVGLICSNGRGREKGGKRARGSAHRARQCSAALPPTPRLSAFPSPPTNVLFMAAGSNSRWEGLVSPGNANIQYDTSGNRVLAQQTTILNPNSLVRSGLIGQQVNTIDPSFYDCIYNVANTGGTVIERCYKDIGCCNDGCCKNGDWHNKYGWAVALIVIFCILVIIAFVIWLVVWLFNRSKDKQLKREMYYEDTYSQMPTPQPTPTHYPPEQYSYDPARDRDNYRY
ncbi:unnamed protein product [Caenorhabditis auriculariae]|uniref:CX domain-containing protein n=1 Tax=Caenorhabditis auriculariae TaxID=2777116 RepID=A0A8S1HGL8_9PELO|nr:unnamed protein product [Caenorhabditis auriculariae]